MSISEEKFKATTSYLLPFEKLHGLGNDFVVVNISHLKEASADISQAYEQELTQKVCDRNFGIGADGLIIIDSPKKSSEAIRSWRYYNSDGSIAEMCGNGIRCAAKYIYEHGLSNEDTKFKIETLAGDIEVELLDDEQVRVNMGAPREIRTGLKLTSSKGFEFPYDYVSMGNPHAINFYEADDKELERISLNGPEIEVHGDFPKKTNVEFARIDKVDSSIKLIVWERGCGFTKACGTGACATAIAAIKRGYYKQDQDIRVKLPGGDLIIRWDSVTNDIYMTGKAVLSFIGYYNDEGS